MLPILLLWAGAFAASTGRFPLIADCGALMRGSVRALEAVDLLEEKGAERGDARLIWPRPVIHAEQITSMYDSAKATGVKLSLEGYHSWIAQVIGVWQVRGTAREVASYLKDLLLMRGLELDLAEWLPAEPEAKDDLFEESDFKKALKGKAFHEFDYSYASDPTEGGRTLAIVRIWPATFFSPRVISLRRDMRLALTRLDATTFRAAYEEWQGPPAWAEIEGEVFLFGDPEMLDSVRKVRREQLDMQGIALKADPRPYLK